MTNAVEELIDQAWEARTPSKRAIFARRALGLDRTAIDAYVALALTVETAAERIALLREGVRHGEALWQPFLKRVPNGFFWGDVETRPFMRAMHNLALALWECGDRGLQPPLRTAFFASIPTTTKASDTSLSPGTPSSAIGRASKRF